MGNVLESRLAETAAKKPRKKRQRKRPVLGPSYAAMN